MKPIWVFDGIPSRAKCEEMQRRFLAKSESEPPQENGPAENMIGRSVRVTPAMIQDAKTLLTLMGCCVIQAPSESEAQCAELVKQGFAYATASDDMDCLVHGTPVQLRGFNAKKDPVVKIEHKEILS